MQASRKRASKSVTKLATAHGQKMQPARHKRVWPYRGLSSFTFADAPMFFGRQTAIGELLRLCREHRLLLLHGDCGSGKTSLLCAGVLPALLQTADALGIDHWRYVQFLPDANTPDLLRAFAESLLQATALPELAELGLDAKELTERIARHPAGLAEPLQQALQLAASKEQRRHARKSPTRLGLLIIVDPLEATLATVDDERVSLFKTLQTLLDAKAWILAAIRDEYLPVLEALPDAAKLFAAAQRYALAAPDSEELVEIICRPAQLAELGFERRDGVGLEQRICSDLAAVPNPLPLLAYLMDALQQDAKRHKRSELHFDAYLPLFAAGQRLADCLQASGSAMQARRQLQMLAAAWQLGSPAQPLLAQASRLEAATKTLLAAPWAQLTEGAGAFASKALNYAKWRQRLLRTGLALLIVAGAAVFGRIQWVATQRAQATAEMTLQALNRLDDGLPVRLETVPGGLTALQESLGELQPLLQDIDQMRGVKDPSLRQRAANLRGLGEQSLAAGDLPVALQSFYASRVAYAVLAKQDPHNSAWRRRLAGNYARIGDTALKQGDLPSALANYRSAQTLFDELVGEQPGNFAWRTDQALNQSMVAAALMQQGGTEEALAAFHKTRSMLEPLVTAHPDHESWHNLLDLAKQGITALTKAAKANAH